jgi:hypothetical protein
VIDLVQQPLFVHGDDPAVVLIDVVTSPHVAARRQGGQAGLFVGFPGCGFVQGFTGFDAAADGIPALQGCPWVLGMNQEQAVIGVEEQQLHRESHHRPNLREGRSPVETPRRPLSPFT